MFEAVLNTNSPCHFELGSTIVVSVRKLVGTVDLLLEASKIGMLVETSPTYLLASMVKCPGVAVTSEYANRIGAFVQPVDGKTTSMAIPPIGLNALAESSIAFSPATVMWHPL